MATFCSEKITLLAQIIENDRLKKLLGHITHVFLLIAVIYQMSKSQIFFMLPLMSHILVTSIFETIHCSHTVKLSYGPKTYGGLNLKAEILKSSLHKFWAI